MMNLNHYVTETIDVDVDDYTFCVVLYSDAVGDAHEIASVNGDASQQAIEEALLSTGLTNDEIIEIAIAELCDR